MQLLNKGYIIKAAHFTCSTIAELGRGMDYTHNNKRRGVVGENSNEISPPQSQETDSERHEWRLTTQVAVNFYFNPLSENFKIRFGDKKRQCWMPSPSSSITVKGFPLSTVSFHTSFACSCWRKLLITSLVWPQERVMPGHWAPLLSTRNHNWMKTICEMKV